VWGANKTSILYVNIDIKGKKIGTVSNFEGKFVLDGMGLTKNDFLIFSYVNYKTQTIKNSGSFISMTLEKT